MKKLILGLIVGLLVIGGIYLLDLSTDLEKPEVTQSSHTSTNQGELRVFQFGNWNWELRGDILIAKNNNGLSIRIEDPSTLEQVDLGYFRDSKRVYSGWNVDDNAALSNVNPNTFVVYSISGFDAVDKGVKHYTLENGNVYFNFFEMGGASPIKKYVSNRAKMFEVVNGAYVTDGEKVYWGSDAVTTDTDHFEVFIVNGLDETVVSHYSKDSEGVYYASKKIEDADVKSFRVEYIDGLIFGIDDENVFWSLNLNDNAPIKLAGISPQEIKVETGKSEVAVVVSDNNTNWYKVAGCHGWSLVSEAEIFTDSVLLSFLPISPTDDTLTMKQKYLDNYWAC